jgi:hypothetical protein
MGRVCSLVCLMLVVGAEGAAQGQGMWRPTPAPEVTAAGERWLLDREPIFYAGDFYYPDGPTVFFNGTVMAPVGFHRGIPLYEDTSEMQFTVIYVPVGDRLMKPYTRRRGSLAPIPRLEEPTDEIDPFDQVLRSEAARLVDVLVDAIGTLGAVGTTGDSSTTTMERADRPDLSRSSAVPRSGRFRADIWIEWQGARWYASGPAVQYEPAAFVQVGTHYDLPIYQSTRGGEELFVTMVPGGPVAPFRKR